MDGCTFDSLHEDPDQTGLVHIPMEEDIHLFIYMYSGFQIPV